LYAFVGVLKNGYILSSTIFVVITEKKEMGFLMFYRNRFQILAVDLAEAFLYDNCYTYL